MQYFTMVVARIGIGESFSLISSDDLVAAVFINFWTITCVVTTMDEATFTPYIDPKSRRLAKSRTMNEFVEFSHKWSKVAAKKVEAERIKIAQAEEEKLTFTPEINRASKKVAQSYKSPSSKERYQSSVNRLMQRNRSVAEPEYKSPSITPMAQRMRFTETAADRLYQDSHRRQAKQEAVKWAEADAVGPFQPKINDVPLKDRSADRDAFENLYQHAHRSSPKHVDPEVTLRPRVLPRSASIVHQIHGDTKVWDRLYRPRTAEPEPAARPKKPRVVDTEAWNRLTQTNKAAIDKTEELRRVKAEQEVAECRFSPHINGKSRRMVDKGRSRSGSTAQDAKDGVDGSDRGSAFEALYQDARDRDKAHREATEEARRQREEDELRGCGGEARVDGMTLRDIDDELGMLEAMMERIDTG